MRYLILQILKIVKSWKNNEISDIQFMASFYKIAKEAYVVASSSYCKYEAIIESDKSYRMNLHKLSIDYIENTDMSDDELKQLETVSAITDIPGSGLLSILSKCPKLISDNINQMIEKISECRTGDISIQQSNIHDILSRYSFRACVAIRAVYEIHLGLATELKSMTESVTEEDVTKYVNHLDKCINELREYYEKSDYSKLMTPRKKTIEKMTEYMKGALDRKYDLNIPLYTIEDAKKDTQDIINNKIFPDMEKIVDKYPEFFLKKPTWDEDQDIYIYLTLAEPFGDKEDDLKRKQADPDDPTDKVKSIQESADELTTEKRNKLPDSEFGIPELRKYPINDEKHIRSAIRYFGAAKPKYKKQLGKNISDKVKELNLVGKVKIKPTNPYVKYFDKFMIDGVELTECIVDNASFPNRSISESITDDFDRLY